MPRLVLASREATEPLGKLHSLYTSVSLSVFCGEVLHENFTTEGAEVGFSEVPWLFGELSLVCTIFSRSYFFIREFKHLLELLYQSNFIALLASDYLPNFSTHVLMLWV